MTNGEFGGCVHGHGHGLGHDAATDIVSQGGQLPTSSAAWEIEEKAVPSFGNGNGNGDGSDSSDNECGGDNGSDCDSGDSCSEGDGNGSGDGDGHCDDCAKSNGI